MLFQNKEKSLELTVVSYEFPERKGSAEEYDFDANWLVLRGVCREGRVARSFENSCLLTYELQALSAGLKLLLSGVRDVYESDFIEPYLEIAAEAPDLSRYLVAASFSILAAEDRWETFSVESFLDEAGLRVLIADIDRACAAFPERKG